MKQITEDYVSFEIAKLLKEKGFDGECHGYYEVPTKLSSHKNVSKQLNTLPKNWNEYNKECVVCEYISISTHQMALKWLREVHNIVIEISIEDYMTSENGELQVWYSYTIWTFIRHLGETGLTDARYDDRAFWQENVKVGQSYEEAVEAALKYTLENLI